MFGTYSSVLVIQAYLDYKTPASYVLESCACWPELMMQECTHSSSVVEAGGTQAQCVDAQQDCLKTKRKKGQGSVVAPA